MSTRTPAARRGRALLRLEELEAREVLSGYDPAPVEQLFLELLNDARANPAAYGASIGLDLSTVAPSQPLAFNTLLVQAARLHSLDMNNRGYFSHYTPESIGPGQRMSNAGFAWTSWGESLAGGTAFPGPSEALRGLIIDAGVSDLGHRRHLLAIDTIFRSQNQIGIGVVQSGTGPLVDYYTLDTASGTNSSPFLTGVVIHDDNANGRYDIGEGIPGVTITVAGVGTTTTFVSGGYSFAVAPGTYTVTASGGGLVSPLTRQVTVGGSNVRLNFVSGYDSFLQNLYQTILGRTGSSAEIAAWISYLQNGLTPPAIVAIFEHSPEAQGRLIRGWYNSYLGRQAGAAEVQSWIELMQQGLTEEQAQIAILSSDESFQRAGSQSNYIQTLYAVVLGRSANAAEVNSWMAIFPTQSRAGVASEFIYSQEFRSNMVRSYYTSLLHRPCSTTEINAWVFSGLGLTDIRIGFETSQEFLQS